MLQDMVARVYVSMHTHIVAKSDMDTDKDVGKHVDV